MKLCNSTWYVLLVATVPVFGMVSCSKKATRDQAVHGHEGRGAEAHAANPHAHSGHPSHSAPDEPAVVPAASYSDAVKRIQTHLASIDEIVKAGKYDDVHDDSEAIRKLCADVVKLAPTRDSGVPPERVQEVTAWANELSTASRSLHSAAHDDDVPRLREQYARMTRLLGSLQSFVR